MPHSNTPLKFLTQAKSSPFDSFADANPLRVTLRVRAGIESSKNEVRAAWAVLSPRKSTERLRGAPCQKQKLCRWCGQSFPVFRVAGWGAWGKENRRVGGYESHGARAFLMSNPDIVNLV